MISYQSLLLVFYTVGCDIHDYIFLRNFVMKYVNILCHNKYGLRIRYWENYLKMNRKNIKVLHNYIALNYFPTEKGNTEK